MKHIKGFDKFISAWNQLLHENYNDNHVKFSPRNLSNDINEYFQKPVQVGSQIVLLQFNITTIENLAMKHFKPHVYSISDIINAGIEYSKEYGKSHNDYEKPIIIVPFPYKNISSLVVDGNHRLTAHIENKAKTIQAFNLDHRVAFVSLSTCFEQCVYGFLYDVKMIEQKELGPDFQINNSQFQFLSSLSS